MRVQYYYHLCIYNTKTVCGTGWEYGLFNEMAEKCVYSAYTPEAAYLLRS